MPRCAAVKHHVRGRLAEVILQPVAVSLVPGSATTRAIVAADWATCHAPCHTFASPISCSRRVTTTKCHGCQFIDDGAHRPPRGCARGLGGRSAGRCPGARCGAPDRSPSPCRRSTRKRRRTPPVMRSRGTRRDLPPRGRRARPVARQPSGTHRCLGPPLLASSAVREWRRRRPRSGHSAGRRSAPMLPAGIDGRFGVPRLGLTPASSVSFWS